MTQSPPEPVNPNVEPTARVAAQPLRSRMGGWALALGITCILICIPLGLAGIRIHGWALGLGFICVLICMPLGLAAVILGIIALAKRTASKGKAVGGLVAGAVALFVAPSVLMALGGVARELARTAVCRHNLHCVGRGVQLYMTDAEQPPADLEALIKTGVIAEGYLTCPSNMQGRPKPHYFYLPAAVHAPSTTIIMCDLNGNHPRGARNVLTLDGRTKKFETVATFQAELDKPENAAFADALKKAEGP